MKKIFATTKNPPPIKLSTHFGVIGGILPRGSYFQRDRRGDDENCHDQWREPHYFGRSCNSKQKDASNATPYGERARRGRHRFSQRCVAQFLRRCETTQILPKRCLALTSRGLAMFFGGRWSNLSGLVRTRRCATRTHIGHLYWNRGICQNLRDDHLYREMWGRARKRFQKKWRENIALFGNIREPSGAFAIICNGRIRNRARSAVFGGVRVSFVRDSLLRSKGVGESKNLSDIYEYWCVAKCMYYYTSREIKARGVFFSRGGNHGAGTSAGFGWRCAVIGMR